MQRKLVASSIGDRELKAVRVTHTVDQRDRMAIGGDEHCSGAGGDAELVFRPGPERRAKLRKIGFGPRTPPTEGHHLRPVAANPKARQRGAPFGLPPDSRPHHPVHRLIRPSSMRTTRSANSATAWSC